jgi:hypothetical protein
LAVSDMYLSVVQREKGLGDTYSLFASLKARSIG